MRALRFTASALLLSLALGAPCLAAARATVPAVPPRAAERGDLLGQLRSFLVSLWNAAGCRLDPFGHCVPDSQPVSPQVPTGEAGCEIDPFGRCAPGAAALRVPAAHAGCELDPWGRCLPGTSAPRVPTGDAGCQIDPWGRCTN